MLKYYPQTIVTLQVYHVQQSKSKHYKNIFLASEICMHGMFILIFHEVANYRSGLSLFHKLANYGSGLSLSNSFIGEPIMDPVSAFQI